MPHLGAWPDGCCRRTWDWERCCNLQWVFLITPTCRLLMKCLTSPEKRQQQTWPAPPDGDRCKPICRQASRRSGGGERGAGKQTPIGLRLHYVKAEEPSLSRMNDNPIYWTLVAEADMWQGLVVVGRWEGRGASRWCTLSLGVSALTRCTLSRGRVLLIEFLPWDAGPVATCVSAATGCRKPNTGAPGWAAGRGSGSPRHRRAACPICHRA